MEKVYDNSFESICFRQKKKNQQEKGTQRKEKKRENVNLFAEVLYIQLGMSEQSICVRIKYAIIIAYFKRLRVNSRSYPKITLKKGLKFYTFNNNDRAREKEREREQKTNPRNSARRDFEDTVIDP